MKRPPKATGSSRQWSPQSKASKIEATKNSVQWLADFHQFISEQEIIPVGLVFTKAFYVILSYNPTVNP
jgi:hypothetical protein